MKPRRRPDCVLPRRLHALMVDLTSASEGDAKALHRTRVASRRVREALPLVGAVLPRDTFRKVRRKARLLTQALGSVRELDVALDVLVQRQGDPDTRRMALERVRAQIIEERGVRRAEMHRRLEQIKPATLVRRLSSAAGAGTVPADRSKLLGRRLETRAARLRAAVEHAGPLYLSDRLHAVRIAIKKLRYALEIAGDYRVGATAQAVRSLRSVQDLLGRMHDIEVVNTHIHRAQVRVGTSDPALDGAFRALVSEGEEECRVLHARFLLQRARLADVAGQAEALAGRLQAADRGAAGPPALPRLIPAGSLAG